MAQIHERLSLGFYETSTPYGINKEQHDQWQRERFEKQDIFMKDCADYAIECGVPKKYAKNIASRAWEDGHSAGFSEVVGAVEHLSSIFNVKE